MAALLFHHGALGDSVLLWPTLRALASRDAVGLVSDMSKARLAAKYIPQVQAIDADAPDVSRLFVPRAADELSDDWRLRLAEATTIVSFVSDGDDAWAANLRQLAPDARLALLDTRPAGHWPGHVVDWHRQSLAGQGVKVEPIDPPPRRNLDGPVVIHPGAGSPAKCWPRERFEYLIDHLVAIGRPVEVVLGHVELETWPDEAVRRWGAIPGIDLHTPGNLMALADCMARAALYVGNDSGPTHLAAQLGIPTIGLFGPTPPATWSPRGPLVVALAPPTPTDMTWLDVEPVAQAVARG